MKRLIFSIYIEIPDDRLDNPASWDNEKGVQYVSDKSKITKQKFLLYKDRLIEAQVKYAELCGADYIHVHNVEAYSVFAHWFHEKAPQISEYDIINFYKHAMMLRYSGEYDEVCYFDLDVVPNTTENIFETFDLTKFHVGDSNAESRWGRGVEIKYYNACIRNPATKFFNAQAMAYHCDLEPLEDVFNTGIMIANSDAIRQLSYFSDDFEGDIKIMEYLKNDEASMYPWNIRRSFGYDNETYFSHRMNITQTSYEKLPEPWHWTRGVDDETKLYHVISKQFELYV
jgi:hypothetical protein